MNEKNKKPGCAVYLIVWIISAVVLVFGLSSINKTGQKMSTIVSFAIEIGALLAFVVFCFNMFLITNRLKKQQKQQVKNDRANGIERFLPIRHVTGLNVPEDCSGSTIMDKEKLSIIFAGNKFDLKLDRIKNVDFQMDIDIKQYLQSSTIKGIAGAAAFGVTGAVIGSAPKTKTRREVKCYAIISYLNSNNEYSVFIIRDEMVNSKCCAKLVDKLRPLINQEINQVDL